ncbi:hypothetical protein OOU_Y34scaffold00099g5 [Pyricularia oryzae Y34]|uniref:Uncharacterized protein n=2 Tax=Pyricularia oryzae TaxID=318829 RepID=A0AA97PRC0_PYRO3|nr:hypothetical protein OOU_Y34scaffold00099g5 [Pyricularia oryzae Y34]
MADYQAERISPRSCTYWKPVCDVDTQVVLEDGVNCSVLALSWTKLWRVGNVKTRKDKNVFMMKENLLLYQLNIRAILRGISSSFLMRICGSPLGSNLNLSQRTSLSTALYLSSGTYPWFKVADKLDTLRAYLGRCRPKMAFQQFLRANTQSRSSSPPSPTTPDPRRPLLPRTVSQPLPRGVPLRYAWRGKMTWPLRGDPRRYSTFPPYAEGNPIIGFGRNAISWLAVAFWWFAAILKMTLWNFPAGLILGLFAANIIGPLQTNVPTVLRDGSKDAPIFAQSAGDAVDQAWQAIGTDMRNIVIQDKDVIPGLDLNKSHVQVAKHYGGGYVLELEAFRNIHCLNVLRQSLYFNARHYHKAIAGSQSQMELMCLADGSAHGFVWVDHTSKRIAPDVNSNHRVCHDFDMIRLWAESRQVPATLPEDYYRPATAEI